MPAVIRILIRNLKGVKDMKDYSDYDILVEEWESGRVDNDSFYDQYENNGDDPFDDWEFDFDDIDDID